MYVLYGLMGTLNVENFWSIMPLVNCKWKVSRSIVSVILQLTKKWKLILCQHILKFTTQAPNVPV